MLKNRALIRVALIGCAVAAYWVATDVAAQTANPLDASPARAKDAARDFRLESIRGKVVWYGQALRDRLGIQTVDEAAERVLALATEDGQLLPIIEDLRGRAFRTDERLRQMEVELRVRRYKATPAVQIVRVYEWRDKHKYQVDYWCDVCAIVMFETGPCSCCQDHNRLRQREVE